MFNMSRICQGWLTLLMLVYFVACQTVVEPQTQVAQPMLSTQISTLSPTIALTSTVKPISTATIEVIELTATATPTVSSPTPLPTITTTPIPYVEQKAIIYHNALKGLFLSTFNGQPKFIIKGGLYESHHQKVSPDHTKIVAYTESGGNLEYRTMVLDIESGKITYVSDLGLEGTGFIWSNNSSTLAFISEGEDGLPYLNYYDWNTKEITKQYSLPDVDSVFIGAGWSADDRYMALKMVVDGQSDVYVFDHETQEMTQLTNTPDVELFVRWSPIAHELLIGSNSDPDVYRNTVYPYTSDALFIVNLDKEITPLLKLEDDLITMIGWRPGGEQVVYAQWEEGLCFITLASQDITCPDFEGLSKNEFNFPVSNDDFGWSSDGQWLTTIVSPSEGGLWLSVYAVNVETGEAILGTPKEISAQSFYWIGN